MVTISAEYQNYANKYFLILINLVISPREFQKIGIISFHPGMSDMKMRITDMNSKKFFTLVILHVV